MLKNIFFLLQVINEEISNVQEKSHRLANDCNRYLLKWKQYSNLWTLDKQVMGEKFAAANPTLQQYDEKFCFYASIIEELDDMPDYFDIFSIRYLINVSDNIIIKKRMY